MTVFPPKIFKRRSSHARRPTPVEFVIGGRRPSLAFVAGASFVGGFAEALFLVLVTRSAFAITEGKNRVGVVASWYLSINLTLGLGFLLVAARVAMASWAGLHSSRLASGAVADVRADLATAFLTSSWETQQRQRAGSLQELLTTYSGNINGLMTGVVQGVVSAANLLAMVGLAVSVDPLGAVLLVVMLGILSLGLRPLRRVVRRRSAASTHAGMEFATSLNEVSELGLELHVFHVQEEAQRRVKELIEETRSRSVRLQFAAGLATPLYSGMAYVALLGALVFVSVSSSTNLTSLGAVMLVMLRSLSYGQALQSGYTTVASSTPAIEELQRQLELLKLGRRQDGGQAVGRVGRLHAESLGFSYIEGEEVLRDLSFTIDPHEIVGVVGPSGGGKSTLVQLLLGLRDPESGRILVDDRDIAEFSKVEWARKVTFVPQQAHLIAGTIADNIRFLRPGVTDERVEQAARLAQLHDDIAAFPEGYERQVGEHGGHLSGGQQQRLCIARALVESPDLLILDEPTSALDVRSEHLVRATLMDLKQRMTIIVIAHRLSTLDICDRIMVIQDGELKAFAAPGVLEQSNEFYREALALSGMR